MTPFEREDPGPPPLDTVLEVPMVCSLPEPGHIVEFADFLLTNLFLHDNGVLLGEFVEGVGSWFVRPLPDGHEIQVGRQQEVGYFRGVLARFGAQFMAGQLYGGFAQRPLSQQGKSYDCEITMSNDNRIGYSLKVYATRPLSLS